MESLNFKITAQQQNEVGYLNYKHNLIPLLLVSFLWGGEIAFGIIIIIAPSYLNMLAAPKWLIGFISALPIILSPLQLLGDRFLGGPKRKLNVVLGYTVCSLGYILYGVFSLAVPMEYTNLHIIVFIIATFIIIGADSITFPVLFHIITDNTPVRLRGRLIGYRMLSLGLGGFAFILPAHLIYKIPLPRSIHYAIILAGAVLMISALVITFIKDTIDPEKIHPKDNTLMEEIKEIMSTLWNTPNYRIFIFFVMLLVMAISVSSFFITYGQDIYKAQNNTKIYNICFIIASLFAGFLVGPIADKWGYKYSFIIYCIITTLSFVIIFTYKSIYATYIAYILYCSVYFTIASVLCNMSVELMPNISAAKLLAGANIFLLPAGSITPFIAGYIIDMFRQLNEIYVGYLIVFSIATVLAIIALFGFIFLVYEPREGKVYVVKILRPT